MATITINMDKPRFVVDRLSIEGKDKVSAESESNGERMEGTVSVENVHHSRFLPNCLARNSLSIAAFINAFEGDLSNLTRLSIHYFNIQVIRAEDFVECPNLEYLNLGNNSISEIGQKAFSKLSELRWLYLYGNKISKLAGNVFSELKNLEELDLSSNCMLSLSGGMFYSCDKLSMVNLECNQLVYFKSTEVTNHHIYFKLEGNPIINRFEFLFSCWAFLHDLVVLQLRYTSASDSQSDSAGKGARQLLES